MNKLKQYALVKYLDDNIIYVTTTKNVRKRDETVTVKYSDGRWYPANVIEVNECRQKLVATKKQLTFDSFIDAVDRQNEELGIENDGKISTDHNIEYNRNQMDIDLPLSINLVDEQNGMNGIESEVDISTNQVRNSLEDHRSTTDIDISFSTSEFNETIIQDSDDYHDDDSVKDPTYDPNCDDDPRKYFSAFDFNNISDDDAHTSTNKNTRIATTISQCVEPQSLEIRCVSPKNQKELKIGVISKSNSGIKKYFCIFCKQLFSKLVPHFENIHRDEKEVRMFSVLPRKSSQRKKIIETLRKQGAFEYNTHFKFNKTDMIVVRRPNKEKFSGDYKICPHCKGSYSKNSIRKHYKICVPNWKKGDRSINIKSNRVRGDILHTACDILREMIFPVLRDDFVTHVIRYDSLAIAYGNYLCSKYRLQHLHKMIRSKLRLMGRFKLEMMKIDPKIKEFAAVFTPFNFDKVIAAVNEVAQLDSTSQEYKSPATASDLGTTLKKCGQLLITICIKEQNIKQKGDVEDFLKILEQDFPGSVYKTVQENQLERKRKKDFSLPSLKNVNKFNTYLIENCKKYYNKLLSNFNFDDWKQLASFTMIAIQIFNRRRAGEIERATIEDFTHHTTILEKNDPELFHLLPDDYQANAEKYTRLEITGKKARGVPVLLSRRIIKYIKIILAYRNTAGVPPSNPFIFGLPGNSKIHNYLKACELMRKFANDSNVDESHLLRGTQLRKQIATQSSVMDLQENEVSDLANFLGHAEKIHRDHYRLPIASREIGRVSQLLEKGIGNSISDEESDSNDNSANFDNIDADKPRDSWDNENSSTTKYGKKRCVSPMGTVRRITWNELEKKEAFNFFSNNIKNKSLPTNTQCRRIIKKSESLRNRSPNQLKAWVSNQMRKTPTSGQGNKITRVYWTSEEKDIMHKEFGMNLRDGILPSLDRCEEVRKKYELLHSRNKATIKGWINNTIRKREKTNY